MVQTRPLTSGDRLALQNYVGSPWRHAFPFAWGFALLWGIAYLLVYNLWLWLAPHAGIADPAAFEGEIVVALGLAAAAFMGFQFASFLRAQMKHAGDDSIAARAERDLAGGLAHVETLNVLAAIEIEEFEDEGTGFFLALEDGRVLCVIGQDLYDTAHDAAIEEGAEDARHEFPHTRIAYVSAPASGIRLDIKGVGAPLRPRGIVETTAKHFKPKGPPLPEDGTFYDGPLDAVLKRFGYVEQPLPPR